MNVEHLTIVVPPNMELRPVCEGDHEWLVELHNDPEVLRNLRNPTPITISDHRSWWNQISKNTKQLRLIFTVDGERVGFVKFCDLDFVNNNCEIGADIHKDHRGKGYAKFMWTLMLEKCFGEFAFHRVVLCTASFNRIALSVYSKLGFEVEGRQHEILFRDGTYHDGVWMYMLRDDWDAR